jgi:hypothetical protein
MSTTADTSISSRRFFSTTPPSTKGPEPTPQLNWSRPPHVCSGVKCSDYQLLATFLKSPSEQVCTFAASQKRRQHLENRLNRDIVTCETVRRGHSLPLRITKTNTVFERNHKAWSERLKEAEARFAELETKRAIEGSIGGSLQGYQEPRSC